MSRVWEIISDWENLDSGSAEERACFAALGIKASGRWLTQGFDSIANRLRDKPYLSAYALAEWFAWNWWRLRWEPRAKTDEWRFAHRMANIGEGYVWPDITIFSDGERTVLLAKATPGRAETPFRYIVNEAAIIPSSEFESGVDGFLDQVLERLDAMNVADTNLARLWADIREERRNPDAAEWRKIEALAGLEPGEEANAGIVGQVLSDAQFMGLAAMEELAADAGSTGRRDRISSAAELRDYAKRYGSEARFDDAVRLAPSLDETDRSQIPAWELGVKAAQSLRTRERLGNRPIDDTRLSELIGADRTILEPRGDANMWVSFALDEDAGRGSLFLRSRYRTGRRFELARLLGDRLLKKTENALYPATRSTTYRQKMQRAFAAELLSPFEEVLAMLEGDYSSERQHEVADHFNVSELTVLTQLVNHRILDRDELDSPEFPSAA